MSSTRTKRYEYVQHPILVFSIGSLAPPDDTILELLEYFGMSQKELAERTGYSTKQINQVILGKSSITSGLAVLLERVLGTSAQTWKNLESHYQLCKARWAAQEELIKGKDASILASAICR